MHGWCLWIFDILLQVLACQPLEAKLAAHQAAKKETVCLGRAGKYRDCDSVDTPVSTQELTTSFQMLQLAIKVWKAKGLRAKDATQWLEAKMLQTQEAHPGIYPRVWSCSFKGSGRTQVRHSLRISVTFWPY